MILIVFLSGMLSSFSIFSGPTEWNNSPDPQALYGLCLSGSIGSGLGSKPGHIYAVDETLKNVLAISVLQCVPFTGGGGTHKASCPPNSPYAYCVNNTNDGLGNKIMLGILELNELTNPNEVYTGCHAGINARKKINLVKAAKKDPRMINGIVTLACDFATTQTSSPPATIACPSNPHLYSYCLATPNDGFGNAVTIGVINANGAADPYGLYGECNTTLTAYKIKPGFLPKSSLVEAVGRSLDNVRTIDLLVCNAPVGFGRSFPRNLEIRDCTDAFVNQSLAGRYNYCIVGTDTKGNGVIAGVSEDKNDK